MSLVFLATEVQCANTIGHANIKGGSGSLKIGTFNAEGTSTWGLQNLVVCTPKPAPKPVSAAPTPKVGDTVTYVNAKGQKKQAQVNKILTTKDAQGDPQIQLTANGAEFAVDKKAIQSVEPAAAPSADAAPDPAIAKQIQTVQAEIKKLNAKQKQELVGLI